MAQRASLQSRPFTMIVTVPAKPRSMMRTMPSFLHVILTWDDAEYLIKEESRCGDRPPFPIAEAVENAPVEEGAAARAVLAQLFAASKPMWTTTYRYDDRGRQIDRSGFAHKVHNFNLSHCSGGL